MIHHDARWRLRSSCERRHHCIRCSCTWLGGGWGHGKFFFFLLFLLTCQRTSKGLELGLFDAVFSVGGFCASVGWGGEPTEPNGLAWDYGHGCLPLHSLGALLDRSWPVVLVHTQTENESSVAPSCYACSCWLSAHSFTHHNHNLDSPPVSPHLTSLPRPPFRLVSLRPLVLAATASSWTPRPVRRRVRERCG
jgi:hypothetical protein